MVKTGTRVIFFFFLAALAACVPLSQDIRRQADESPPFSEIQKNPDKFRGTIVVWGGVIIETTNLKESTAIKVMQTALDIQRRPTDLDRSEGRFVIRVDRFLDPDIFRKGREITVGGSVADYEVHPIGEIQLHLPRRAGERAQDLGETGRIPAVLPRPAGTGARPIPGVPGVGRIGSEQDGLWHKERDAVSLP